MVADDSAGKDQLIDLSAGQLERYFHHIAIKDIGGEGQRRLLASKALIVGVGGLGSPAALYLAAAGLGTIGLVDDDTVEISNLQRQIVHATRDIGRRKVDSAAENLNAINPDARIAARAERLTDKNAAAIVSEYDFVIDATDNFQTKYLINDACVAGGKPYSFGGATGFKGQAFTFVPGSACMRCIFPEPPPEGTFADCRGGGILGAVAGIVGAVQAAEAIKVLLGKGTPLAGRLLSLDALAMEFKTFAVARSASCPLCGRDAERGPLTTSSQQGLSSRASGCERGDPMEPVDFTGSLRRPSASSR